MDIYVLTTAGVNFAEGVERFSGMTAMYEKFLRRFTEDVNYRAMCDAIAAGDVKSAFAAAHALKGIAGNLSLTRLYDDLCPLVEKLRAGRLQQTDTLLAQVGRDYDAVIAALTGGC